MNYLYSIIIPVYTFRNHVLKRSLDSCQLLNCKFTQVILINDNNNDKLLKFLRTYKYLGNKNVIFIDNKKNLGLSYSRNKGIKSARGKYIIFLDHDDYLVDEWKLILKKNNLSLYNNNSDLFFTSYFIKKDNKTITKKYKNKNQIYKMITRNLPSWSIIYKTNTLISKKIFFDESLKQWEDLPFILRVFKNNSLNFKVLSTPIRYYDTSDEFGITRRKQFCDKDVYLFYYSLKKSLNLLRINFKFLTKIKVKFYIWIKLISFYSKVNFASSSVKLKFLDTVYLISKIKLFSYLTYFLIILYKKKLK